MDYTYVLVFYTQDSEVLPRRNDKVSVLPQSAADLSHSKNTENKGLTFSEAKFQPDVARGSGDKVDFIVFTVFSNNNHLTVFIRLNYSAF